MRARWKLFVPRRLEEHPICMAVAVRHSGTRVAFWAVGVVLCAVCSAWCVVQMVRAGGMSVGLVTLALFWGLAAARAVEYLLAARRGDAHVGHNH